METSEKNTHMVEQETTEIDLLDLAMEMLQHIKLIIIATIIGGILSFGATRFLITPEYTASSMVYIFTKTTSVTSLADLQLGSQLTADFTILATSRPVVERVIEELYLDASYEQVLSTIQVENQSNTRIIKISATNPDPQLAADISNAMSDSLCKRVAEVMDTDEPSSVEKAIPPTTPSSPDVVRNTALGALLMMIITVGIVSIRYLLDDTIKTAEDVTKYLNINTLAEIPVEHDAEIKKNGSGKKRHKGADEKIR